MAGFLLVFFVFSLFFIQLVFDSSRSFYYSLLPAWMFSFFLIIAYLSKAKIFLNWIVILFFLFAALSLLSTVWSVEPSRTFVVSQRVMAIAFVLFGFWLYIRERNNVWFFVNTYLSVSVLATILGVLLLHDAASRSFLGMGSGTVGPLFGFASVLGVAGWVIKRKKKYILASAVSIFPVLLVGSVRGVGLFLVFLSAYGLLLVFSNLNIKRPKRFVSVILMVAVTMSSLPILYQASPERFKDRAERNYEYMSAVLVDGRSAESVGGPALRVTLQKEGLDLAVEEFSLFGKGLHSTYSLLEDKIGMYTYTHSTHWEVIIGLGLVGAVLFYGILIGLLVKLFFGIGVESRARLVLISIVVAMFSLSIIGRMYTNIIFVLMLLVVAALHDWLARRQVPNETIDHRR